MQVHRELDAIRGRGAELVFVGNGNRTFGAAFRDEHGIRCPIYVDSRLDTYKALGMKRNPLSLFKPGALASAARALKAGHRQTSVQGDAWQLGGVLVVRKGGAVAFRHLSEHPGDHPPVSSILKALGKAKG